MNKALKNFLNGNTEEAAASQQEAKHELAKLEQALKGENPADENAEHVAAKPNDAEKPTDSPRKAALHLANEQRKLAQQTQQAENKQYQKRGEAGKKAMKEAMEKVAQKQQELNKEASKLPVDHSQKAMEQAHEAMRQASKALANNDPEQAKRKQNEAADRLNQLAAKAAG